MSKREDILSKYLEAEASLNLFFRTIGYCQTKCTAETKRCCTGDFSHKDDDLNGFNIIHEERIKKFEPPKKVDPNNSCGYHTGTGCTLKYYKGPTCLAYLCGSIRGHLEEEYGIIYEWVKTNNFLEGVLIGTITDKELENFKLKIQDMIEHIEGGDPYPFFQRFP